MNSSYRFVVRCFGIALVILPLVGWHLSLYDKDVTFLALIAPVLCTGVCGLLVPTQQK